MGHRHLPAGLTRKSFITTAAAAGVALYLPGCDLLATDPESERDGSGGRGGRAGGGRTQKEAPVLAAQVKQGKLPPLRDRLPENPLVVEPVEQLGTYGGVWNSLLVSGEYIAWMDRQQHYDGLLRYDREWKGIIPDLAESYDVRGGGTEYEFRLRRGVKWSDGERFTADDVMFWYEDVFMNEELTPVPPTDFLSGGKPPKVEKVDDHTVVFRYETPHGLLPRVIAGGFGDELIGKPRHYLERFHKKYNPDGIKDLVDEARTDNWVQLFLTRADWSVNPDLPVLNAWVVTTPLGGGLDRIVAKRNPYFWKVDPDGRQLPYIDEIHYYVMENLEAALLKAQNGEFGQLDRHINTLRNKPVLARSREKGEYRFFDLVSELVNEAMITLNLTHKDAVKREIYGNKDFRIGLSHAINREEIIDAVYQRQGEPWQSSPRRESEFHNERLAKQFTEYDVAKANAFLDRAGYSERDDADFRLGPDGKRITIQLECTGQWDSLVLPDVAEFVTRHWRAVGIAAEPRVWNATLMASRTEANLQDASIDVDFGGLNILMDPRAVFPHHGTEHFLPWVQWYESSGQDGERPPAPMRRQMSLYNQIRTTIDADEQSAMMKEIIDIAADMFTLIGIVLPANGYGIVRNDFRNVPKQMIASTGAWYPTPGPSDPHQYFIAETTNA
jgi:peptide/nickel transport system substrate-binding protein